MGCTEKDDIPGGHEADPPWEGAGNHVIEDGQPYGIDGSMEKSGEQPLPPEEYRGLTEDVRSSNGDRLSVISGPGADGLLGVRLLSVLGMDDLASARALIKKHNLDDITEKPRVFGSPLHLVALIGSYELTKTLVEEYSHCAASWINAQDANEQQTALHIASKNGNYEIVCLLLDIDCVDDTIQDYEYRLASDLSPSRQIYLKFKSHREIFVEELKAFVSANIESKEGSNRILQRFADGSKAQRYLKLGWFDINSPLNKTTNQNILHLASKYENNDLIEWALNLGSDANVKDSRGRRAIDFIPKRNSIIRQKLLTTTPLKQKFLSGNLAMGLMIDHADNITEKELPVLKDTLFKWTNYASGFRPRFFVIENGVLSYYKTASDYPNACKGSVNLLTCNVEIDNKDSTRLGVYISGKDKPHFSLQARSQVYAKQWFWAMVQSKMILSGRASSRSEIQPHGTDPAKREPQLSTDPQHLDQVADLDRSMEPGDAIPIHNDYPAMIIDSKRDLQIHRSKLSSHLNTVINIVSLIVERFDAPGDWDDVAAQKYLGDESDSQPKITDVLKNAGNQLSSAANDLISTQLGKEARLYEWCRRKSQYIKICEDRLNKVFEEEKETNPPRAQDVTQGARIATAKVTPLSNAEGNKEPFSNLQGSSPIPWDDNNKTSNTDSTSDSNFHSINDSVESLEIQSDRIHPSNGEEREDLDHAVMQASIHDECAAPEADKVIADTCKEDPCIQSKHPFIPITDEDATLSSLEYLRKEEYRTKLPLDPSKPKPSLHIWSFIKSSIGKDLSRITVPVFFNEPLSTLQRLCEDVAYVELLTLASRAGSDANSAPRITDGIARDKAKSLNIDYDELVNLDKDTSAALRVLLVSIFAVSSYSSTERVAKPFNPLLGETFELCSPEKGYRYITEQVCHHPPISASHCESPDYCMSTEAHMKSRFWGKTFEITPAGYTHLLLAIPRSEWPKLSASDFGIDHNNTEEAKKYGLSPYEPEVYYWKKVSTYVTNFVFGKMKLENRGNITVVSKTTGVKSSIGFVKPKSNMSSWITDWGGGSSKDKDDVEVTIKGEITSEVGEVIWEITGNHFKHIFARPSPNYAGKLPSSLKNGFVAWSAEPYPPGSKNNYDFTYTALSLNQLTPQLRSYLPSSDSRLRPDQRHMEDGAWDKASVCKEALEMYQRRSRASLVNLYSQTAIPSQRPDYDEILNSIAPENQARHIGESWWRPRWFVNCYDTITKTNYWRFTGDYWSWRNVVFPNPQDAKKSKWPPWVPDMYHEKNIENLLSDSPGEKIT